VLRGSEIGRRRGIGRGSRTEESEIGSRTEQKRVSVKRRVVKLGVNGNTFNRCLFSLIHSPSSSLLLIHSHFPLLILSLPFTSFFSLPLHFLLLSSFSFSFSLHFFSPPSPLLTTN